MHPFCKIDKNLATYLAKEFSSPLFIIAKNSILSRYNEFYTEAKKAYYNSKIAISYKTNPSVKILSAFHKCDAWAEVVSGEEYQIAKYLNIPGNNIIFNGPMKTDKELTVAINEEAYINCDNYDELIRIESLAQALGKKVKIGIRLCLKHVGKEWNRFGFHLEPKEDLYSAYSIVGFIQKSDFLILEGIHAHIGTDIRDLQAFEKMAESLNTFCWELKHEFNITLAWIDVGGGLAGLSPSLEEKNIFQHSLPILKDYIAKIVNPLSHYLNFSHAQLFFEPGRTVFEPYGAILMEIVGKRISAQHCDPELIFNAAYTMFPSAYFYNHPVLPICESPGKQLVRYHFYGYTCDQADILRQPLEMPGMKEGDFVLLYGVGAYSMTLSMPFIRYRPGIVLWDEEDNSIEWVRKPETFQYHNELEII